MASKLVCVADYERYAENNLSSSVKEFFNAGANYEQTYTDNVAAFNRYKFRPRYMRDVSNLQMSSSLLGHSVSCPIGVSPMGMCRMAHPDGEVAMAKACESEGLLFCLGMVATSSIEEVAEAAPACKRWFQVYLLKEREMTRRMVQRAERAGFGAIVLTVDHALFGKRYEFERNPIQLLPHYKLATLEEEVKQVQDSFGIETLDFGFMKPFFRRSIDPSQTWRDIQWLKTITSLPVVAKGIMTGPDAIEALNHGADAIWVSNHAGRHLDGLPSTIDALGEVCQAVEGRAEVYLDGGVRSGLDILKALSRGARAVFCGHPALWGLVHNGEEGTRNVFNILREELSVGMGLTGVTDARSVPRDIVVHESYYSRL